MLRSLAVLGLALVTSAPANATCVIDRLRPMDTIPTMAGTGQTFMFLATNDCTTLQFSVSRTRFTRVPTMGAAAGVSAHWWSVELSDEELQQALAITGVDSTTFSWTISGAAISSGDTTRVSMTNEIDVDGDGWTRSEGDAGTCDRVSGVNPAVVEMCGDTVDSDCDGFMNDCPITARNADAVVRSDMLDGLLGSTVAIADVNGDGIGDLLYGAPAYAAGGLAYVSFGPLAGRVDAGNDVTISSPAGDRIGESIAGGDADGDGFGDVLIGVRDPGVASLLLGPVSGDVSTASADLELYSLAPGPFGEDEQFSYHTQIGPDVDGDGATDIVITAPLGSLSDGVVYVVPGTTTGSLEADDAATYTFRGPRNAGEYLGLSTTDLGDTDGDGTNDLAMDSRSFAYIVPGGLPGGSYDIRSVATTTIRNLGGVWGTFADAAHLASLDYDDDGYRDLLVGDPYPDREDIDGMVHLLLGPFDDNLEAGPDDVVTFVGEGVGHQVAVGDCNGDGEPDYLLAGRDQAYLGTRLRPVHGIVDVRSLQPFVATDSYAPYGAYLFAPDWSGDGVQEVVVGAPYEMDTGLVFVHNSEQF